jgi:hypothetical protein
LIAVDWGSVEETFIVWRIEGNYSIREFQIAYNMVKNMALSKNYPIDTIVDLRLTQPQLDLLPQALNYHQRNNPHNIQRTIILYHDDFWQRNFRLLENFFPNLTQNLIFTSSVDEAYLLVLPAA